MSDDTMADEAKTLITKMHDGLVALRTDDPGLVDVAWDHINVWGRLFQVADLPHGFFVEIDWNSLDDPRLSKRSGYRNIAFSDSIGFFGDKPPDLSFLEKSVKPSGPGEWLLALLMTRQRADSLFGDLEELFHRDYETLGLRRARWLYARRLLSSLGPILWSATKKVATFAHRNLGR